MKTKVRLCYKQQTYEIPKVEIVRVVTEMGFAHSGNLEYVGKDEEIEF